MPSMSLPRGTPRSCVGVIQTQKKNNTKKKPWGVGECRFTEPHFFFFFSSFSSAHFWDTSALLARRWGLSRERIAMAHQLGAPLPGVPPPQPQQYGHEMHQQHGNDGLEDLDGTRVPRNCPRTHPWCSVAGCIERPLRQYLSAPTNQVRRCEQERRQALCWVQLCRLVYRNLVFEARPAASCLSLLPWSEAFVLPPSLCVCVCVCVSRRLSGVVNYCRTPLQHLENLFD